MSALDKLVELFPNRVSDNINLEPYRDDSYKVRVKNASEYRDALLERLKNKEAYGDKTGFSIDEHFRFRPYEMTVWVGYKGHGKALDITTPIPTPDGWKTIGDIVPGDSVYDENGKPCAVVAVTEVMNNRPCYSVVFSDGTQVIADENHEWLTSTYAARASQYHAKINGRESREAVNSWSDQSHKRILPSVVTTGNISNTMRVYESGTANALNHCISASKPLVMPERDLPINPYLLGAWLGDGTSACSSITVGEDEMLAELEKRIGDYKITKLATIFGYGITGGMHAELKLLNLVGNKHIPSQYLRGSVEQRLELMRGLLDTDGHIDKNGRIEFCNTNERLAFDFLELSRTFGIVATMIIGRATLYGKDCGKKYRVFFTTNMPVFSLPRKLDMVKKTVSVRNTRRFIVACYQVKSVPVKCIEVNSSSHLYLATTSFVPTHNSAILSQVLLGLMQTGKRVFVCSPEFHPIELLFRFLIQCVGSDNPRPDEADRLLKFLSKYLWLYDVQASLKPNDLPALCRWVVDNIKPDHIVIDSLMKCGIAPDDYGAQKNLVDKLQTIAHQNPLHFHLVAHARKGMSDDKPPKLHDIKGASEIGDLVENVIAVWRNKPKEMAISSGDMTKADECDAMLTVEAQRNCGGWVGMMPLQFQRSSMIYYEQGTQKSFVSILGNEVSL